MTTKTEKNAYEDAARHLKVTELVDALDRHLDFVGADPEARESLVANLSDAVWANLDAEADLKHPSSQHTRAVVAAVYNLRKRGRVATA